MKTDVANDKATYTIYFYLRPNVVQMREGNRSENHEYKLTLAKNVDVAKSDGNTLIPITMPNYQFRDSDSTSIAG